MWNCDDDNKIVVVLLHTSPIKQWLQNVKISPSPTWCKLIFIQQYNNIFCWRGLRYKIIYYYLCGNSSFCELILYLLDFTIVVVLVTNGYNNCIMCVGSQLNKPSTGRVLYKLPLIWYYRLSDSQPVWYNLGSEVPYNDRLTQYFEIYFVSIYNLTLGFVIHAHCW